MEQLVGALSECASASVAAVQHANRQMMAAQNQANRSPEGSTSTNEVVGDSGAGVNNANAVLNSSNPIDIQQQSGGQDNCTANQMHMDDDAISDDRRSCNDNSNCSSYSSASSSQEQELQLHSEISSSRTTDSSHSVEEAGNNFQLNVTSTMASLEVGASSAIALVAAGITASTSDSTTESASGECAAIDVDNLDDTAGAVGGVVAVPTSRSPGKIQLMRLNLFQ